MRLLLIASIGLILTSFTINHSAKVKIKIFVVDESSNTIEGAKVTLYGTFENYKKEVKSLFSVVTNAKGFVEFKDFDYLPSTILLTGGGSILSGIKDVIKDIAGKEEFSFTKKLKVKVMTPQHLEFISDQTGKLESPQEIVPLSLSMMILDFLEEEGLDIAMQRGIKLIEK